jgi:hypothetical protein
MVGWTISSGDDRGGSIKLPWKEGAFFREWGTRLQERSEPMVTNFALQRLIQSKRALTPGQQVRLREFSQKRGLLLSSNQPSACEIPVQ